MITSPIFQRSLAYRRRLAERCRENATEVMECFSVAQRSRPDPDEPFTRCDAQNMPPTVRLAVARRCERL